jgi:hypothetical protein
MNQPSYELQLKASENRKELQSSLQELRHRIFRTEAKNILVVCGALALITAGAILRMLARRGPKSSCAH